MKLLVDAETDRVLGASMCGPDAPEIIQVKHMYNSLVIFFSVFWSFSPILCCCLMTELWHDPGHRYCA